MHLTRADLEEHLQEQLQFLNASCAAYDAGNIAECKRIALALRILLHDGGGRSNTKSLLGQLKLKEKLSYINTAYPFDPSNLMTHAGLVVMEVDTSRGMTYVPAMNNHPPTGRSSRTSFQLWWEEIIFSETGAKQERFELTRKSVVLGMADKDGGAHIDTKLEEKYAAFARKNALGWMQGNEVQGYQPAGNPIPAAIRQIAYELLETIRRNQLVVFQKTNQKVQL